MLDNPGLYVHFPWCVRKCPYCDFNSHPLRDDLTPDYQTRYLQALKKDWLSQLHSDHKFSSVFFGGGTPSLFHPAHLNELLQTLPIAAGAEITLETNPGTAEYTSFADIKASGINRISFGAQSFNDAHLVQLGRIHQARETYDAYEAAMNAGFNNINLDIMWGLPEQTVAQAMADLDAAIRLNPNHISWYQLTIEAKTEYAKRPPILPAEPQLAEIEAHGLAKLAQHGYVRYEVSAFAQANQQCKHNLNYWQFGDYVGIGAGAHGKQTNQRDKQVIIQRQHKPNPPRLYQNDPQHSLITEVAEAELPLEFMMNALRLTNGVDTELFAERTGQPFETIEEIWQQLSQLDLVVENRIQTTPSGLRYLDSILARFT